MKTLGFYGAAGTVTGSCFGLSDEKAGNILIDCGMFQGNARVSAHNYEQLAFDASSLDAVFLTHAHLDHCGRLPLLTKQGFQGKFFMTEATRSLLELSLYDAVKVAHDNEDVQPMYSVKDVADVLGSVELVEYGQTIGLGHYHVIYRDAGHILGSASIEVHHPNTQDQIRTIVFSGDLGNSPEMLLQPTENIQEADVVVMESTYGGRTHADEDPSHTIMEEVNHIEESGGTLLIPSFSIERSQEILHILDHLKSEGKVRPETRVFLDSPMAIKATSIYKRFKQLYSNELYHHAKSDDPFHFQGLHLTQEGIESRKIRKITEPKVIIAGSGMMTGGRILHHAIDFLPEESTRLLFVGFQAEDTLGRQILEGATTVQIGKRQVHIRASVRKSSGLSSHADHPKLLSWLGSIKGVQTVYLVHGEDEARHMLSDAIKEESESIVIKKPGLNDTRSVTDSN